MTRWPNKAAALLYRADWLLYLDTRPHKTDERAMVLAQIARLRALPDDASPDAVREAVSS